MFAKVIVAATLVSGVYSLTVASPASLVQCQPVQLSWGQGTAPFYVSIIPGGQPSAAALESFPTTSDTSMTWVVDLSAGTEVTVKVVDSTGDTNYSSQVTIQAGSTTQCSSSSGAAGAGSASAPAASSAPSSSAAAATTTRAANRASSAADEVTSSAGSMVTSARNAASSVAGTVTSGIGAAAASASKSATGAASSVKASSALVGSLVAGAAMLYALA